VSLAVTSHNITRSCHRHVSNELRGTVEPGIAQSGLQALKHVQNLQEVTKVSSVASALSTAHLLGHGADPVSVPVAATLLLAAALLVASKKLQELEKRFGFLDWQHSEH